MKKNFYVVETHIKFMRLVKENTLADAFFAVFGEDSFVDNKEIRAAMKGKNRATFYADPDKKKKMAEIQRVTADEAKRIEDERSRLADEGESRGG